MNEPGDVTVIYRNGLWYVFADGHLLPTFKTSEEAWRCVDKIVAAMRVSE